MLACADSILDPDGPAYSEEFYAFLDEGFDSCSNVDELTDFILWRCHSRDMLKAVVYLHGQIDIYDWLVILGNVWCNPDCFSDHRDDLVEILKDSLENPFTTIRKLMNAEENVGYDKLTELITIYRGCCPATKNGLSWSLSREEALKFAWRSRYGARPILLTATISKHRAAAFKLERDEQEVIVVDLPESCWTEEYIPRPADWGK